MLILGIDLGTSFLKVCIYDADSVKVVTSIRIPEIFFMHILGEWILLQEPF